jgi:hypothetical protein
MTWLGRDGGYDVLFNRDERRTRQPAAPPRIHDIRGVRYIAPADGDFGGSWIGANSLGLTLCLLNGYRAGDVLEPLDGEPISRGLLLTSLMDCEDASQIEDRLAALPLSRYCSFLLAVFQPLRPWRLATWSGQDMSVTDLVDTRQPLISSSFDTEAVCRQRRRLFREIGDSTPDGVERLMAYHRSHRPERGPNSPCMHRPDAATVSFSHVQVDAREVRFDYAPRAPCRGLPSGEPVVLPRD